MMFILSWDQLNDIGKLKESILEDFDYEDEEIDEADVDKIIKYLQEIDEGKSKQEEKIYSETINILLLGQTGCGKSTFINSFQNYMKHCDLDRLRWKSKN